MYFTGTLLDDMDDLSSTNSIDVFLSDATRTDAGIYPIRIKRFVIENKYQIKNGQDTYWNLADNYCSLKKTTTYYGEDVVWQGTINLVPIQAAPLVSILDLKGVNGDPTAIDISFQSASGSFDFSENDFSRMYSRELVVTVDGGLTRINPTKYSLVEAQALTPSYIYFNYKSTAGTQISSSQNVPSGFTNTGYSVLSPFLNSKVQVRTNANSIFITSTVGQLEYDTITSTYSINNSTNTLPTVAVSYQD